MAYTLIHNGTLVDGNGGAPVADGAVLVEDNTIRAVGRKVDIRLPAAPVWRHSSAIPGRCHPVVKLACNLLSHGYWRGVSPRTPA